MKFSEVFKSYMVVSGTDRGDAYQDRLKLAGVLAVLGDKDISSFSPMDLTVYLASLRDKRIPRGGKLVPLQPSTINKHTQFIQRIIGHADALLVPVARFQWRAFHAIEAEQTTTPLTIPEELSVLQCIDDYIRPLFQFSILTGIRLTNAYTLRWSQIDLEDKVIRFQGKSKRPGGKLIKLPLTGLVAGLLLQERGNHPEFVFTFKARRNNKHGYVKGERYPLTKPIVSEYWKQLETGKRWHDVRHTFGTRMYGKTKDIHLVQRAMNHSDIQTTMRYVHTDNSDVAAAMESMGNDSQFFSEIEAKVTQKSRTQLLKAPKVRRENEAEIPEESQYVGALGGTRTPTLLRTATSRTSGYRRFIKNLLK
jgi:integrase